MATVLAFPASRPGMARIAEPGLGAEIVFFPGVRLERREDASSEINLRAADKPERH